MDGGDPGPRRFISPFGRTGSAPPMTIIAYRPHPQRIFNAAGGGAQAASLIRREEHGT